MSRNKIYPLSKSPLYRLRNRKKLAKLLFLRERYFYEKHNYKYKQKSIPKSDGSERVLEIPDYELKKIQARIHTLLQRIETPYWLKSGKKGESHITNAMLHLDSNHVRTMDISRFYDSVSRNRVYHMFRDLFLMEDDIATIMTNLVMHGNVLPTGAPSSQLIAYWAYQDMFSEINEYAIENNYKFSLYVDDMTFSSENSISYEFREHIAEILKKNGLYANRQKDKQYGPKAFKIVTGCGIKNGRMRLQNKRRKEIIELYNQCSKDPCDIIVKQLRGKLIAARQEEPDLLPTFKV